MRYRNIVYRGCLGLIKRLRTLIKGQTRSEQLNALRSKGVRYEVVEVNDYRMKIDLNDNIITPSLFLHGQWEPYESQLIIKLLRPGMTFIDIGAHVGYHSLLAARAVGPTGRVISFEPSPDNYSLLKTNIDLNNLSNVIHARNAALDEKKGTLTLFLSSFNTGDHRIYSTLSDDDQIFNAGAQRRSVSVSAVTLDDDLSEQGISHVDMIKIDVQGAEMAAFSGMRNTLLSNPNVIVFTEFWPHGLRRFGTEPQALLSFLMHEIGLSLFRLLPEERQLVPFESTRFLSTDRNTNPLEQVDLLCCLSPAEVLEKSEI